MKSHSVCVQKKRIYSLGFNQQQFLEQWYQYSGVSCGHHKRWERIQPKYRGIYCTHSGGICLLRQCSGFQSSCHLRGHCAEWRNTGEDIGLYKLRHRTQSSCVDPSDRRQSVGQTKCRVGIFCRLHQTSYHGLRFSYLISDTNEETVNTVALCWGCTSRSKLIFQQLNDCFLFVSLKSN